MPRTTRASPPQPMLDRITVMPKKTWIEFHSAGIAAERAIHSGMLGKLIITSMPRWMRSSTMPPR